MAIYTGRFGTSLIHGDNFIGAMQWAESMPSDYEDGFFSSD
jgi:hypothetical protein